ncbi:MAG: aminotransferase class V-fold PLP-dependent enzyme [Gemmatimonadetes bacterium]|nr:aminotransferase class V-fold PLP-dependent enzyme [Gemmatimonadota bacterium]
MEELIRASRRRFPATERWIYLDTCARGLLSTDVRAAVDRYLDDRMCDGGNKTAMFETVERARKKFARLINADADEVAYTKNVSEGLNAVATAIPWKPGDNVVLCPELEHPNNVYLWLNLRRRHGIEVRAVPARDGHIPSDVLVEAMDARTRVVTVSSVTFAPGFRTDLRTLADACRERDVLLLVDAAQSVGVLHTDVHELGVDAVAVSTQKGLLAFYGMGFLYCRREWAERLTPAYLARFGVDLGDAHEASMGDADYRLMPAARRFDLGNYNFLGATAADAAFDLLLELGTERIEKHAVSLAHRLARGMMALGLPVCGGEPGPHLGHIVTVGRLGAGQHDSADDATINELYSHLRDKGVKHTIRRGVLRFALHLYNDETDVDRTLALTRHWLERGQRVEAVPSSTASAGSTT